MASYCWNPHCTHPKNSAQDDCCRVCHTPLRLRDRYRAIAVLSRQPQDHSWRAIDLEAGAETTEVHVMAHFITPLEERGFDAEDERDRSGRDRWERWEWWDRWERHVAALKGLDGRLGLPELIEAWRERNDRELERGYVVRPWIDGQTLAQEQQHRSPLDETQARSLLADLLPRVQYIHSRRFVHGNLQPETLTRDRAQRLIPIDFRYIQPIAPITPIAASSRLLPKITDYCAPECLRGGGVPASDLYSLGAIAVQSLTTLSPLELYDPIDDRWPWRDFLPPEYPVSPQFGRLLDRLLATSLKDRYARASEVLNDLNDLPTRSPRLTHDPIATTIPIPPAPKPWQRWLGLSTKPALSPTGLDCTDLRDTLAAHDWSAADRETARLLCVATQTQGNYLHGRELDRLAADDLVMIDRLWREASDDWFGWSVQQRIYREGGGDYVQFCARVGWPLTIERTVQTEPWQYRRSAAEGHLPSRRWAGGQAMRSVQLLFDRLEQCQIALPPRRGTS